MVYFSHTVAVVSDQLACFETGTRNGPMLILGCYRQSALINETQIMTSLFQHGISNRLEMHPLGGSLRSRMDLSQLRCIANSRRAQLPIDGINPHPLYVLKSCMLLYDADIPMIWSMLIWKHFYKQDNRLRTSAYYCSPWTKPALGLCRSMFEE